MKKGGRLKAALFGDFNFKLMCMPRWPFGKHAGSGAPPPFYGPHDRLGILTALLMGLQHALAMTGGLITPPLLIGALAPDETTKTYLIQAALLVCGITTAVQVTGFAIPKTRLQLGAGLLSVMGVSFASVPLYTSVIKHNATQGIGFDESFGRLLGTTALCALWPVFLSFLPYRTLRRVFPPIVTGVVVFLIGTNLTATAFRYWGGGAFCAANYEHQPARIENCIVTNPITNVTSTVACFAAEPAVLCSNNGDVQLPFGSGPYVGLGLLVFVLIVLLELFGSPFMRNSSLVLALLIGLLVSALIPVDGKSFVTGAALAKASPITFLWVLKRFPLGFTAPAIIPLIIVFTITSVETVGDVTATAELSGLVVEGEAHVRRLRGSILNDGLSSLLSALAGSMPLTTFAQNNGVLSLTNVTSRHAGWAAAGWLFLFGLVGKVGALVLTIPQCVLGGALAFLFASVVCAGIKIITSQGLKRRNRFIVACALAFGLGVTMVPQWAENNLWPLDPNPRPGVTAARLAVMIILETGFCIGGLVAFILNLVMPDEIEAPAMMVLPGDSVHHSKAPANPTGAAAAAAAVDDTAKGGTLMSGGGRKAAGAEDDDDAAPPRVEAGMSRNGNGGAEEV